MSEPHETSDVKAGVDLARVRATIAPVLSSPSLPSLQGVSLVDVEWLTDRGGWVLRLTIERELGPGEVASTLDTSGGVSLEDCAEVSRSASAALDLEDFIPHHYHLEVSSPGLDRPLRTAAEFARFVGRLAKVKLRHPHADGQRVLRGTLEAATSVESAESGSITMLVDGKRVTFAIADVAEAQLVFELAPQPKIAKGVAKGHGKREARPSEARQSKSAKSEKAAKGRVEQSNSASTAETAGAPKTAPKTTKPAHGRG